MGPSDLDDWASVGVTLGARPGTEFVYAYEPRSLGFVVSEDGMRTFTPHSRGLFVGPYVREGAHVRANASGTAFFAVINGLLYAGRTRGGEYRIAEVRVEPAVFSYARRSYVEARDGLYESIAKLRTERDAATAARKMSADLSDMKKAFGPAFSSPSITISARIEPGGKGPEDVTVDLSPLGGAARAPMHDDGRHGDGAADDGVYAARHELQGKDIVPDGRSRRRDVLGTVGLWVTAGGAGEVPVSAAGVLSICTRPESFVFRKGPAAADEKGPGVHDTEGEVTVETGSTARKSEESIKITARGGRWLAALGSCYRKFDVTGYHSLSFWIRADEGAVPGRSGPPDVRTTLRGLNVHLGDFPENTPPVITPPVPVAGELASGSVLHASDARLPAGETPSEGGTAGGEYRLVTVPIERLREGARGFQPNLTALVVFSGEVEKTTTYWLDDIRFFVSEEDLEDYRQRARLYHPEGGTDEGASR